MAAGGEEREIEIEIEGKNRRGEERTRLEKKRKGRREGGKVGRKKEEKVRD